MGWFTKEEVKVFSPEYIKGVEVYNKIYKKELEIYSKYDGKIIIGWDVTFVLKDNDMDNLITYLEENNYYDTKYDKNTFNLPGSKLKIERNTPLEKVDVKEKIEL